MDNSTTLVYQGVKEVYRDRLANFCFSSEHEKNAMGLVFSRFFVAFSMRPTMAKTGALPPAGALREGPLLAVCLAFCRVCGGHQYWEGSKEEPPQISHSQMLVQGNEEWCFQLLGSPCEVFSGGSEARPAHVARPSCLVRSLHWKSQGLKMLRGDVIEGMEMKRINCFDDTMMCI